MPRFPYGRDHLHRFEENPILTLEDMPFKASAVFNGSPVKKDGVYYLLLRIEGQKGYSFFALAHSHDGLRFKIEKDPVMLPAETGEVPGPLQGPRAQASRKEENRTGKTAAHDGLTA